VSRADRAVSSTIATVLVVAVVVIAASTVGIAAFGISDRLTEPAPAVAQTGGEFVPQDGDDGGIVRIEHLAGDAVDVAAVEVVVDAECDAGNRRGRLVDLPATTGNDIDDDQIEGTNLFDQRSLNRFGGGALLRKTYASGDEIVFRIPKSKCAIGTGDAVSVRIVHLPSGSTIVYRELIA